jgi:hypothetical protein
MSGETKRKTNQQQLYAKNNEGTACPLRGDGALSFLRLQFVRYVLKLKHIKESLLRYLDFPELPHPAFTSFLLFQQFPLPRNITTITLSGHILPQSRNSFPGNHFGAHCSLNSDDKLLSGQQFL